MFLAVRSDGQLLAMTYQRDEEVVAWSRIVTRAGDTVESVAVLPASDGKDEIWVCCGRDIDGTTAYHIEQMQDTFEHSTALEDGFFVDDGLTYDGTATKAVTGMLHLAGETVRVLADGGPHSDIVVGADGSLTLDYEASVIQAGLDYDATIKSQPLEAGAMEGTAQGKTKRISRMKLRFYRTLNAKIGPTSADAEIIPFREEWDVMDSPPDLFTGIYEFAFTGKYDREGQWVVVSDTPTPLTLLAAMPSLETAEAGR
jgi:hypothetical protein